MARSTEEILGGIFGSGWDNLFLNPAQDGEVGGVVSLLLNTLSITVLATTMFISFFVFITALAETGSKGELGGQYANKWTVIRMTMTAGLLVPVGGYSVIHILVLMAVGNVSLPLASNLGVIATEHIATMGGTFSNPIVHQNETVIKQMFRSASCQAYYNNVEYPARGVDYRISDPALPEQAFEVGWWTEFTNLFGEDDAPVYAAEFNELNADGETHAPVCGYYAIECQDGKEESVEMCQAQYTALFNLHADFKAIADSMTINRELPVYENIVAARQRYQDAVGEAARIRFLAGLAETESEFEGFTAEQVERTRREAFIEEVKKEGFFGLGAWYMTVTHLSQRNSKYLQPNITIREINLANAIDAELGIGAALMRADSFFEGSSVTLAARGSEAEKERQAYQRRLADLGQDPRTNTFLGIDVEGQSAPLTTLFGHFNVADSFGFSDEPITGIQSLGNALLITGGAWLGGEFLLNTDIIFSDDDPVEKMKKNLNDHKKRTLPSIESDYSVAGGLRTVAIILMALGAFLLFYVPGVIYMIWTMGCIGYLLTLYETLLAITLWIASNILPSGDGFLAQIAKQGMGMLLNVIARPPLMVIGLFGGAAIMEVSMSYFIPKYHLFAVGMMSNRFSLIGLIPFLVLTAIEVALIVVAVHKTHSSVFEIPDNVMRWISSNIRPQNEDRDEAKIVGAIQTGGSNVQGALRETGRKAVEPTKSNQTRG